MKQLTLAMAVDQCGGFGAQRKPTRREAFLDEMNRLVPYSARRHIREGSKLRAAVPALINELYDQAENS